MPHSQTSVLFRMFVSASAQVHHLYSANDFLESRMCACPRRVCGARQNSETSMPWYMRNTKPLHTGLFRMFVWCMASAYLSASNTQHNIYVFICACVCVYIYLCVCVCMYIYTFIHVCMYVCVCVCVCVCIYTYIYIYMCVCVCVCVCVFIHIYVYKHLWTRFASDRLLQLCVSSPCFPATSSYS